VNARVTTTRPLAPTKMPVLAEMFAMTENVFLVILRIAMMIICVLMILVMPTPANVLILITLHLVPMVMLALRMTFVQKAIVSQELIRLVTMRTSVPKILVTHTLENASTLLTQFLALMAMPVPYMMYALTALVLLVI